MDSFMVCVRPALLRLGVRLLAVPEFQELSAHGILWRMTLGASGPPCRRRTAQAQMAETAERELRMTRATDVYFVWSDEPQPVAADDAQHEGQSRWTLEIHYV
jgi:hypothetical protein